ncbi:MAG: hypothetical protein LWX52_04015 [Deltaproteobacteria bacterium]|jgi:hypothetical protein|nr:hypothetical protein [Deltaproteobacteria bacterium]
MEASLQQDKKVMDFRESLKTKIFLDRLVRGLKTELSTPADGYDRERNKKLKEDVRKLVAHTEFEMKMERSLELYIATGADGSQEILVLGRELPLYHGTSVEDVGMRKDPWINEMLKFRNIKKILSDKDIIFTRGVSTVDVLHGRGLSALNLQFHPEDIFSIQDEALDALRRKDGEGVLEMLELLFELTGYREVTSGFVKKGCKTYGKPEGDGYTNLIICDERDGHLKGMLGSFVRTRVSAVELFVQVTKGKQEPDMADVGLIEWLSKQVLRNIGVV